MTAGQSLADGAAGKVLLHLETGRRDAAYAELEKAVAAGVSIADSASLYYGAPALAFVLATCDDPRVARAKASVASGTAVLTRRRLEAAHRRIDLQNKPEYAEYDLIRGLTGLGVALRRIGDIALLRDVLTYLVRLTEPIGCLPGWWCRHGPARDRPSPVGGHGNQGIAHGIPGPLALLSLAYLDGIHVDGHTGAIERIVGWLDDWQHHTASGAAWWPPIVTLEDLRRSSPAGPTKPGRPSWCYGTPGIARAYQLAARALGDTVRQFTAEDAFTGCVNDPEQTRLLIDRSLCHGTAGLLATGRRIAEDAHSSISLKPLLRLHQKTVPGDDEPAGFLTGSAGAELAVGSTTTRWGPCLLLC
ncbi:lanthionine synthetase C family protein [Actinomadura atramentaria]|uniref:lanthionine synthetase C family protein n=1 Tax=Actinomadura atramentaria TaxID=1990 RepID=UPI000374E555|nr:lanthionine synthetase C family protein [Actinomadura atramentaria]